MTEIKQVLHILSNYSFQEMIDNYVNHDIYFPKTIEHFKPSSMQQRAKARKGRKSSLRKARNYAKNRFKNNKENFDLTVKGTTIPAGIWLTAVVLYVLLIALNIFAFYARFKGGGLGKVKGKLPWIAIILIIISYVPLGLGPLLGIPLAMYWPSKAVWPLKK